MEAMEMKEVEEAKDKTAFAHLPQEAFSIPQHPSPTQRPKIPFLRR